MPVILENGSDQIRTWLDPSRSEWSKELQSLLKPFDGELECYPVSKDVGKVGNNSPAFIVPVASTENKNNIANFFNNAKASAKGQEEKRDIKMEEGELKSEEKDVERVNGEGRVTIDQDSTEDNAPIPVPAVKDGTASRKREHEEDGSKASERPAKVVKTEVASHQAQTHSSESPKKATGRQSRSATSNGTASKANAHKASNGSQKITNFFNK